MAEEVARIDLESDEVVQVGGYGQQVQAGAEGAFGSLGCTYGLAWSWKGTVFAPCGAGRWFRLLSQPAAILVLHGTDHGNNTHT